MLRKILLTAIALAVFAVFVGATRPRGVRKPPAVVPIPGAPTFSNEVVRIFQDNCQTCHHPGDIAPFSLMTYKDAMPWASAIRLMTTTRRMPPWKPTSGCGEFADARLLTQEQIDTIAKWVDAGAPEGNPADLPAARNFDGGWTLGQPSIVLANAEAYTAPSSGDMYRCFTLPTNQLTEKWVSAIDVRPGDRKSVHHVIAFLDTTPSAESVSLDEADPAPGYTCFGGPGFTPTEDATLGGWAPGYRPTMLPDTVGFKLPANARVVLQVHYNSHNGQPEPDRTSIGIYFAEKRPAKQMYIVPLINNTFTIPPNDANFRVGAAVTTPLSARVWLIAPHMHLLGRKINVEMKAPLKGAQCLINIDDWDFNWQGMYRYKEPIEAPAGSTFSLTAYYDNSSNNLRNPSVPPKPVSWGEATTDEMCLAFLGVTFDIQNLQQGIKVDASWIPPLR